jgi:hypothetical protein
VSGAIEAAVAVGRRVAAGYRPDTCQVVRGQSLTPDGAGGYTETPNVVGTHGCVLTAGATRPSEAAEAERLGATVPYFVRNLPFDATILATDELVIGGRTFRVLGVLRAEAVNVAQTAVCEERA